MGKNNHPGKSVEEINGSLSRRQVLIGAASAALVASVPAALAVTGKATKGKVLRATYDTLPMQGAIRRYMAASVCLSDGRVLVTGGFGQPATADAQPMPLRSAVILDPNSGACTHVAPMNIPRARHASVVLRNGLVVVVGGFSAGPTASVEVYDPQMNEWKLVDPLQQPRYDHSLAFDGANIFVIGGSSQSMIGSVEVIRVLNPSSSQP